LLFDLLYGKGIEVFKSADESLGEVIVTEDFWFTCSNDFLDLRV